MHLHGPTASARKRMQHVNKAGGRLGAAITGASYAVYLLHGIPLCVSSKKLESGQGSRSGVSQRCRAVHSIGCNAGRHALIVSCVPPALACSSGCTGLQWVAALIGVASAP